MAVTESPSICVYFEASPPGEEPLWRYARVIDEAKKS
jgi:hypothetical protein